MKFTPNREDSLGTKQSRKKRKGKNNKTLRSYDLGPVFLMIYSLGSHWVSSSGLGFQVVYRGNAFRCQVEALANPLRRRYI